MKATRLILTLLVGAGLIYLSYKSKYESFFFDAVIWAFLIFVGFVLFLWSVIKDLKKYRLSNQIVSFSTSIIAILCTVVILVLEYNINKDFDKPTLLKVFYNGDYNGTGIDFKKDGTYIFDNSAIGLSNFKYGTYKITGDNIVIDKTELDKVIVTKLLEIRNKQTDYPDSTRSEQYLYQLSESGHVIENATEFRVVLDNRSK